MTLPPPRCALCVQVERERDALKQENDRLFSVLKYWEYEMTAVQVPNEFHLDRITKTLQRIESSRQVAKDSPNGDKADLAEGYADNLPRGAGSSAVERPSSPEAGSARSEAKGTRPGFESQPAPSSTTVQDTYCGKHGRIRRKDLCSKCETETTAQDCVPGCACLRCSMEEEGIPKSMQVSAQETKDGPVPEGSRTSGGRNHNAGCESRRGHALSAAQAADLQPGWKAEIRDHCCKCDPVMECLACIEKERKYVPESSQKDSVTNPAQPPEDEL